MGRSAALWFLLLLAQKRVRDIYGNTSPVVCWRTVGWRGFGWPPWCSTVSSSAPALSLSHYPSLSNGSRWPHVQQEQTYTRCLGLSLGPTWAAGITALLTTPWPCQEEGDSGGLPTDWEYGATTTSPVVASLCFRNCQVDIIRWVWTNRTLLFLLNCNPDDTIQSYS